MSNECNHFWVKRTDGYEEQCIPAICLICGLYGCYCRLKLEDISLRLRKRRLELFKELGIAGEDHRLEKEQSND